MIICSIGAIPYSYCLFDTFCFHLTNKKMKCKKDLEQLTEITKDDIAYYVICYGKNNLINRIFYCMAYRFSKFAIQS